MTDAQGGVLGGTDAEFEQRFARVESLLAELAHSTDPMLERATREVVATVLELHQRGLERLLTIAACEPSVREALAQDSRVSAMLLLHGLHPVPLRERVARSVANLRDRYRAKLESLDFETRGSTEISVRVVPAASACQSTRAALKKELEDALLACAPDVEALRVEFAEAEPALVTLRVRPHASEPRPTGGRP